VLHGTYRDVLTGAVHVSSGSLPLAQLLEHLPVALLVSEQPDNPGLAPQPQDEEEKE
jgi:hypothetical protein